MPSREGPPGAPPDAWAWRSQARDDDPARPRHRRWVIESTPGGPDFDVETTGLHEFGHSLDLGHFGSPPTAIMNPAPPRDGNPPHTYPSDSSAICSLYASWPRP